VKGNIGDLKAVLYPEAPQGLRGTGMGHIGLWERCFVNVVARGQQLVTFIVCHDASLVREYAQIRYFQLAVDEQTGIRRLSTRSLPA
jgi:hypothetical protein